MKRNSLRDRRECFEQHKWVHFVTGRIMLTCHICGGAIDPAREQWEAEHYSPLAIGGTGLAPAHPACHRAKTSTDVSNMARGRDARDRHFNIRPRGWGRSKWKRKINGEVVER
jgi:hypothetical protein